MVPAFWLAVLMPPVFALPFPQAPDAPAAIALVGGQVSLQRACYSLACLQAGWQLSTKPLLPAQRSPFAMPRVLRAHRGRLHAPATRREWVANHGSNARLGTRYGIDAIRDPDTRVSIEIGSGYRLQPYADDGIGHIGPVARGSLSWLQRFGDRTRLQQQVRVETGRGDTYVRNLVSLEIALESNWTLRSTVDLHHDSAVDDTATQGAVQLRYRF